jgi:hypothetical protein
VRREHRLSNTGDYQRWQPLFQVRQISTAGTVGCWRGRTSSSQRLLAERRTAARFDTANRLSSQNASQRSADPPAARNRQRHKHRDTSSTRWIIGSISSEPHQKMRTVQPPEQKWKNTIARLHLAIARRRHHFGEQSKRKQQRTDGTWRCRRLDQPVPLKAGPRKRTDREKSSKLRQETGGRRWRDFRQCHRRGAMEHRATRRAMRDKKARIGRAAPFPIKPS